jgi:uncharacterized membrane protein
MNSNWKSTLLILTGFTLILAACATPAPQPTAIPTLAPTDTALPTLASTDTAIPPTDTPLPAPTDTPAATSVSFANDVMPILQNRCFNCHGGEQTKEGLSVASYESLMAGSDNGPVVVPGDAANSLLAQQLLNGKMPKKGPKLTPSQIQIIVDWINAGALNN